MPIVLNCFFPYWGMFVLRTVEEKKAFCCWHGDFKRVFEQQTNLSKAFIKLSFRMSLLTILNAEAEPKSGTSVQLTQIELGTVVFENILWTDSYKSEIFSPPILNNLAIAHSVRNIFLVERSSSFCLFFATWKFQRFIWFR